MSTALAPVQDGSPSTAVAAPRPTLGLIRPIAPPADVLKVQEETRAMIAEILQEGRDYGVIPGTDKPSMLKPGAERTALSFGCMYGDPEIVEKEIDHDRVNEYTKRKKVWRNQFQGDREFTWSEEHGTSRGLYRFVVRVPVIHRESATTVGYGIGSCSTMESKYIDRPRDSENTALKMAHKRALIGACLITFGLSDQFTQDVEDMPREQLAGDGAPELEKLDPPCPKCKGKMWDNRLSKKSPKQPDFKCKNKQCDGVVWPPRENQQPAAATSTSAETSSAPKAEGMTLEEALNHPLPGGPNAFKGNGGKALHLLSTNHLASIATWLRKKMDEAAAAGEPEDPVKRDAVRAIDLVVAHRTAEEQKQQGNLLDGQATTQPNPTELAPGKVNETVAPSREMKRDEVKSGPINTEYDENLGF